ncbi:hypothetical protein [Paenibacillus hamazuiensis]|uniref:hypothetical protein n=1 Tax=Paenibacillus hamazuiensis TaxID=2936508 RepID=UPI00200E1FE8|nr:hypothetical protein [Paenibacillus hamazuiensis]
MKRTFGALAQRAAAAALLMALPWANAAGAEASVPSVITVVKEAPFYASAGEETPTGRLSAYQTLKIKDTATAGGDIWYKIDTWLGEQWISRSSGAFEGEIESVAFTAHTLRVEPLYDTPSLTPLTEQRIAPQEIYVTGRYHDWYRIMTADRSEKWLDEPLLLENIREEPAGFDMLLTRETQLYEVPYLKKSPIALAPQTVHVIAGWDTGKEGYRFREIVWYKIETDQGPRWVLPADEKIGVKPVHETVSLPTGGYGVSAPETNDEAVWFEPGAKLEAMARWNGWFQVKASGGRTVWINPERSLRLRPPGTAPSRVTLQLTGETAVYTYPSPNAVAHPKGYYAPQEVESIAKWSGDDRLDWYLFRGADGDLWLPKPRSASDRSLVGSWTFLRQDPGTGSGKGAPFVMVFGKNSQRHAFERQEGIPFSLTILNASNLPTAFSEPVEFELQIYKPGGPSAEDAAKLPEPHDVVWTRKLPPLQSAFPGPGAYSIHIEWDQRDEGGHPAPPGEYSARIVPVPIRYEIGEGREARSMSKEEMQAALGAPEVFAIMPE